MKRKSRQKMWMESFFLVSFRLVWLIFLLLVFSIELKQFIDLLCPHLCLNPFLDNIELNNHFIIELSCSLFARNEIEKQSVISSQLSISLIYCAVVVASMIALLQLLVVDVLFVLLVDVVVADLTLRSDHVLLRLICAIQNIYIADLQCCSRTESIKILIF